MSKWESEFNQLMSAQRDELDHDYGSVMQQAWENGLGNFSAADLDAGLQFDSEGIPMLGEYAFGTTINNTRFLVIDFNFQNQTTSI